MSTHPATYVKNAKSISQRLRKGISGFVKRVKKKTKVSNNLQIYMISQPASSMRYKTAGDWWYLIEPKRTVFEIRTVETNNPDYNFLVLLHELVEGYLCLRRGVKEEAVTRFDLDNIEHNSPGDLVKAPYHKEHMIATRIEGIMGDELKINWEDYEKELDKETKKIPESLIPG